MLNPFYYKSGKKVFDVLGRKHTLVELSQSQYYPYLNNLAPHPPPPVPTPFLWGASTSAFQIEGGLSEGGRGPSIWDNFSGIDQSVVGDPNIACNSYYQYMDDIALLTNMGANSYRFSISWSRILPDGSGNINQQGIDYYNNVINACISANITPVVTIYHWDLPNALQIAYNGWLCTESYETDPSNIKIVTDFVNYSNICFTNFGDRVKHWATINELQTIAVDCYEYNWYAPGTGSSNGDSPNGDEYMVGYNLLLAHANAVDSYRKNYQPTQNGKIGIVCNMDWGEPYSNEPDNIAAAQRANTFWGGWFWDPVFFGDWSPIMKQLVGPKLDSDGNPIPDTSRLPTITSEQSILIRGSIDILMLNTYSANYVQNMVYEPSMVGWTYDQQTLVQPTASNGWLIGATTESSWLNITPFGPLNVLTWLQNRYSRSTPSEPGAGTIGIGIQMYDTPTTINSRSIPVMITENGMDMANQGLNTSPDVGVNDTQRWQDYYIPYLSNIQQAVTNTGIQFIGYLPWSLLDNFEWTHGYTCRFGMNYINFLDNSGNIINSSAYGPDLNLPRIPKNSASWYKQYIASHPYSV
jgi:beta-glucosidase